MMNDLTELRFTKDWTNPGDFPTHESSEAQVRADMQYLFNEIRDWLNQKLLPVVGDAAERAALVEAGSTLAELITSGVIKSQDGESLVLDLDNGTVDAAGRVRVKGTTSDGHTYTVELTPGDIKIETDFSGEIYKVDIHSRSMSLENDTALIDLGIPEDAGCPQFQMVNKAKGVVSVTADATEDQAHFRVAYENGPYENEVRMYANRYGAQIGGLTEPVMSYDAVPKEYVDENTAPAGYGLGSVARFINAGDLLTGYTSCGFYYWNSANTDENKPFVAGELLVVKRTEGYCKQIAFSSDHTIPQIKIRQIHNSVVGEWEWVNPPMAVGVEYRTTERWNGKPVYTKIVDCGNFPSLSEKTVTHNIANIEQIISCQGFSDYLGLPLPYFGSAEVRGRATAAVSATRNAIAVTCTAAAWTQWVCYAQLKYTKTTD